MKSSSINKMPKGTNIKDLHCYSGMVNYLIKYSARLAKLGDSLRELTKKNVPSLWGPEHTETFEAIKKEITSVIYTKIF